MDVADEIIILAARREKPISNLNLQLVMYFLNAVYLVEKNKPLLDDVVFEVGENGPFISSVYNEYSQNVIGPIFRPKLHIKVCKYDNNALGLETIEFKQDDFEKEKRNINVFIKQNLNLFLDIPIGQLLSFAKKSDILKGEIKSDNAELKHFYERKENQFWMKKKITKQKMEPKRKIPTIEKQEAVTNTLLNVSFQNH